MSISAEELERIAGELTGLGAATAGESGAMSMHPTMRAVWPGARLCAPAFTARCVGGDNLAIHVAVTVAPPSSALVVSVGGMEDFGYWGEVLTTAAEARGLAGLVIEGGVRDSAALEAHRFPVFSTKLALKGASKTKGGETGADVEVGGVCVRSGDWVLGDSDGVVVIGREKLEDVLTAARARAQKEARLFSELRAGRTTLELLGIDSSPVERRDPVMPQ